MLIKKILFSYKILNGSLTHLCSNLIIYVDLANYIYDKKCNMDTPKNISTLYRKMNMCVNAGLSPLGLSSAKEIHRHWLDEVTSQLTALEKRNFFELLEKVADTISEQCN